MCTRWYVSASHSSIAAEVITIGASTAQTESTVVLTARKLALPLTSSPLVQGCCPRLRNLPVVHHRVTTTYVELHCSGPLDRGQVKRTKLETHSLIKRLAEGLTCPALSPSPAASARRVCSATVSSVVSAVSPVVSPVFAAVRATVDAMRNHRDSTDGGSCPSHRPGPNHPGPAHTSCGKRHVRLLLLLQAIAVPRDCQESSVSVRSWGLSCPGARQQVELRSRPTPQAPKA